MTASITALAPHFRGGGVIESAERTYPAPSAGELRIRIGANAICGTDRNEYFGGSKIIPGHEAAGVVEAVGADATTPVGTRGVIYLMDFCGACRACRAGATNQCSAKRRDVGQSSDGGFGPYALVHESQFFPITDDVPLAEATMLLDVMGTSIHALRRAELVRADAESIFIAGAGPIGLGLLVMAKLRYGADFPVHVSDISPWRRMFAESLGAIPVDARDSAAIAAARPDVAFDSSGRQTARETALQATTQRGVLVCVGHGEGLVLDVSRDLIAPERAVLGSEYFRFDEMDDNLRLLQTHLDVVRPIVTHRRDVAEISEAFELFLGGETGKVVVIQDGAQ